MRSTLVRGVGLARVYTAADLTGLFVSVAALAWGRLRRPFTSSHFIAIVLVAVDFGVLLAPYSPWREGLFGQYAGVQVMVLVAFAAIAVFQGVLWRFSPSR